MLCCFRRRGKYTTAVVNPDYKERQKPHPLTQPVQVPKQNPPASRPESSSTLFATVGVTATQNKPTEPLKATQETVNNVNSVAKAKPAKKEEKPEPLTEVKGKDPPVDSAEKLNLVKSENTKSVTEIQEKIDPVKSAEKVDPAKIENTKSFAVQETRLREHDPSVIDSQENIVVGEKSSREDEVTRAKSEENPFNFLTKPKSEQNENTEPVIEAQDNDSFVSSIEKRKSKEHEVTVVKEARSTKEENTRTITDDQDTRKSDNFVEKTDIQNTVPVTKVHEHTTRVTSVQEQTANKTSENSSHDTNIETTVISTTTTREESNTQKNTQSDKVQGNIDNILAAASIILTHHQNEQNKTEVRIEQEDDMARNRTKISINVDNSDIMGGVPLAPRRSLLMQSSSMEPDIEEGREEDVQEVERELENNELDDVGQHSKVTFGKVNEYYTQERREGIREAITVDTTMEIPKYPKSAEDVLHLTNAFAGNDFLQSVLKGETLYKVIDAMSERDVRPGEIVIQEGDPGNNLYVSMRGTYEVYVKKKLFSTFNDKRVFGELAILYNSKRLATIKAVTAGKVWVLKRSVYQQVVVQSAIQEYEETLLFLRNVPLVNKLNDESLTKITNLLQKEFFKTDTVIVREGEPGDKFYIIRAGSVTITKEKEGKVSELGRGAFFGERALLKDEKRQATVTADAPGVECLTLTSVEFRKHFNDLSMQSQNKPEPSSGAKPPPAEPAATRLPQNEFSHIELDDLERRATLGVGGFGRVELVQHREEKKWTFALKYLKKIDMLQQEQVEHVFNERDIQISCDCIFIARMYKTFKDDKYLYFLMESCLGGDLWTHLQKKKGRMVPEIDARFYAACVLEALAYLHKSNIIYRDLKPENLLIDSKGYIKMTDFGFAKNLKSATKTYTFAGTPEYVAPEIIYNRGHDKSVDYWAFGILIYELLVGKTPFRTDDRTNMMTYNRILRGINSVSFPPHVTKSASNLILKLCRPISIDRLGNQKNGIQDIRQHKWFQGFDWEKLRNEKMKAPFVPKLSSNVDTKYFEKFSDDDDIPPDELSSFNDF